MFCPNGPLDFKKKYRGVGKLTFMFWAGEREVKKYRKRIEANIRGRFVFFDFNGPMVHRTRIGNKSTGVRGGPLGGPIKRKKILMVHF